MSRDILIYGAGGAGRELAYTLSLDENLDTAWKVRGFIDDTEHLWGKRVNNIPVLGGIKYLMNYSGNIALTLFDYPEIRQQLIKRLKENKNINFPNLISCNSIVASDVSMGEGSIIIGPYSSVGTNVKIDDFAFINLGTRVGHDAKIGAYTTIFSGIIISGHVNIGSKCLIGSGAIILPKIKVGDGSIIGAGAVVNKDIPPRVLVVGVPAKILKKLK